MPPDSQRPTQLVEQYIRLAEGLPERSQLPLATVAERLCCGERNARLLLSRMQALGWLAWKPGRGRGQLSELSLRQDPAVLRVQQLQRLLEEGRVEAAFSGLPVAARSRIRQALPAFLGATPGGGLRIPFYRPLHALDPQGVTRRTESHIVSQLCDGLTMYDREAESIRPALAHHWEASDDGRQWRFWLRPGLRFQDGRPLRAQDVAATLLRLRDAPGPHRALMAHLLTVNTAGQCIEMQLSAPDHLMPHRLAHHSGVILPEGDWHRADFATLPIGAGAFRLVRNNEHRATLVAFEGYWGVRPLIDEIDLWVVAAGSELPAVDLKIGQLARATPEAPAWRTMEQAEQGCEFLLLNPARATFATSAARCAIGHWLRSHVARTALGERFRIATGWRPGWDHAPVPEPGSLRALAPPRQLLLVTYELADLIALARSVAAAWEAVGTRVQLEVQPAPQFATRRWHRHADMAVSGEVLSDDMEFGMFEHLSNGSSFHAWLPEGLKRTLARHCQAIAADPSPARRQAAMEAGFAQVTRAGALLPMRHLMQQLEHAPHLGGVSLARCGWMDFRKLWLPG
ncbi:ABC transporter substrate-binding protein [Roseateles sp. NT4]|uniref:ABC transporter substrate-binding protein n=1 Tax=Roseateles sp. NT4 TaxID=3453715 RepID=UPI003EE85D14